MRSFWTDLKRGLRHWVKPTLDTTRVERVYHHFDEACHYREYLERCQAATPEEVPWEIARTVRERGFEHLRVMSVEQAAQLREMVVTRTHVAPLRKSAGMVNRLHLDDPGLEERLLNAVLPPSVAEKIRAFFGSEFFVYWFTVTRALPVREQTRNSFLWHCDRGPLVEGFDGQVVHIFALQGILRIRRHGDSPIGLRAPDAPSLYFG